MARKYVQIIDTKVYLNLDGNLSVKFPYVSKEERLTKYKFVNLLIDNFGYLEGFFHLIKENNHQDFISTIEDISEDEDIDHCIVVYQNQNEQGLHIKDTDVFGIDDSFYPINETECFDQRLCSSIWHALVLSGFIVHEEYKDELLNKEITNHENMVNTKKETKMNNLKDTLRTAFVMNKNSAINATTVVAGKALNRKACQLIRKQKGLPPFITMFTESNFGEALVGNLIAIGIMSFTDDPKALTAARAMIEAGSFQVMENLNIEGFLSNLLSGVVLQDDKEVEQVILPVNTKVEPKKN